VSTLVTQLDLMTGESLSVPSATGAIIPEPMPQNIGLSDPVNERIQDQLDDLKKYLSGAESSTSSCCDTAFGSC